MTMNERPDPALEFSVISVSPLFLEPVGVGFWQL